VLGQRTKTFLSSVPPLEVDVLSKKNYKWNMGKEVEAREMVDFSRAAEENKLVTLNLIGQRVVTKQNLYIDGTSSCGFEPRRFYQCPSVT
jgi:hypothetical protein